MKNNQFEYNSSESDEVSLIKTVKEEGSPRISTLSKEEKARLLDEYRENFDSLSSSDQKDFLEEFMLHSLVSDEEAVGFVERISDVEQVGILGEYIGRILPRGKFVQTFYSCFDYIRDEERNRIVEALKYEGPDSLIMILPFETLPWKEKKRRDFDWNHAVKPGSQNKDNEEVRTPEEIKKDLINEKNKELFKNFEVSKKVIEEMIKLVKRQRKVAYSYYLEDVSFQEKAGQVLEEEDFRNFHIPDRVEEVVLGYMSSTPIVLLPYAKELISLGFFTEDDMVDPFLDEDRFISMPVLHTEEEEKERKELADRALELNPKGNDKNGSDPQDIIPRRIGHKLQSLDSKGKTRFTRFVLENFEDYRDILPHRGISFLKGLLDSGMPVFVEVGKLGLSKEEIGKEFFRTGEVVVPINSHNLEDLEKLLEFNRANDNGPDLEKIFVDTFLSEIREFNLTSLTQALMENMEKLMGLLSEENREHVVRYITENRPALWMHNIKYMLEHEIMSLRGLLNGLAEDPQDYRFGLDVFVRRILYHSRILGDKDKDLAVDIDILKSALKEASRKKPEGFLYVARSKSMGEYYSEEEIRETVDLLLRESEGRTEERTYLILKILQDKILSHFKDQIHDEILENEELAISLTDKTFGTEDFLKVLSVKEVIGLYSKLLDIEEFDAFKSVHLEEVLVEDPELASDFIKKLSERDQVNGLVTLAYEIDRDIEYLKKGLQAEEVLPVLEKNKTKIKNKIKKAKENRKKDEEIKKLELSLAEIERKIVEKKEKLEKKDEISSKLGRSEEVYEELKNTLIHKCKENPNILADEKILVLMGEDVAGILEENIDDIVTNNPEILHETTIGGGPVLLDLLSDREKYFELLEKNIRFIAFSSDDALSAVVLNRFPLKERARIRSFQEKAFEIYPYAKALKNGERGSYYYEESLRMAEDNPFFEIYEDKLKAIYSREKRAVRTRMKIGSFNGFQPDRQFETIIKSLGLLKISKFANARREEILNLDKEGQKELLPILSMASIYGLDEDLPEKAYDSELEGMEFGEATDILREKIVDYLAKSLSLEEVDVKGKEMRPGSVAQVLMYLKNVLKNNPNFKESVKDIFEIVFMSNDEYKNKKFWIEEDENREPSNKEDVFENMKQKELIPRNLEINQYEEWVNTRELQLEEVLSYDLADVRIAIKNSLDQAVADQHIEDDELGVGMEEVSTKLERLLKPLRKLNDKQKPFKDKIKRLQKEKKTKKDIAEELGEEMETHEKVKQEIRQYREENGKEIARLEALKILYNLKKISSAELEKKQITVEGKNLPLSLALDKVREGFSDKADFLEDVNRLEEILGSAFSNIFGDEEDGFSKSKLVVTDETDFETHFFIGERPVPSCQNYRSESTLNRGLMSYILDPDVKIVQVRDSEGGLIARGVLRMVQTEEGDPALFLERVYSVNLNKKIRESVVQFAKDKARSMGLGLFSKEAGSGHSSIDDPVTLERKNGISPRVYSDAGEGLSKPKFKISKASRII